MKKRGVNNMDEENDWITEGLELDYKSFMFHQKITRECSDKFFDFLKSTLFLDKTFVNGQADIHLDEAEIKRRVKKIYTLKRLGEEYLSTSNAYIREINNVLKAPQRLAENGIEFNTLKNQKEFFKQYCEAVKESLRLEKNRNQTIKNLIDSASKALKEYEE